MTRTAFLPKGKFGYKNVVTNLIKKDGKKTKGLL